MTNRPNSRGFTLMEVLITVAIVGILSAIAVPSYQDYVRRGRIPEATGALADIRLKFEQHFQDGLHTYDNLVDAACVPTPPVGTYVTPRYFTYGCVTTPTTFVITATGDATRGMSGYIYTINQNGAKTSTLPDGTTGACWLTKAGQTCSTGF